MPSISLQKLSPSRSLRRLHTAFTPSDSMNSSSPTSSSPTSAVDFRGLDKTLDAAVTNLILTNVDERGGWANTGPLALSPSLSNISTSPVSPAPEPWKPDTWQAPVRTRSTGRVIRRKKSKVELQQVEERREVSGELLGMIEPRPGTGVASGGIEEVLCGDA